MSFCLRNKDKDKKSRKPTKFVPKKSRMAWNCKRNEMIAMVVDWLMTQTFSLKCKSTDIKERFKAKHGNGKVQTIDWRSNEENTHFDFLPRLRKPQGFSLHHLTN